MTNDVVQIRVDRKLLNRLERVAPVHLAGARERQVAWAIEKLLRRTQGKKNRRT